MSNPINIDQIHSQAICQEIGERLRDLMRTEVELPASLRKQVDQICTLEGQSPSIVPAAEPWDSDEPRRMDQTQTAIAMRHCAELDTGTPWSAISFL